MANPATLKPFKKGYDARRNSKGRPKDIPGLKELLLSIAHEDATGKDGQPLVINGHKATVIEAVMRQMLQSKNPRDRQIVLEYMFGKVPNPVEVTGAGGGPLNIQMTWGDNDAGDGDASPD